MLTRYDSRFRVYFKPCITNILDWDANIVLRGSPEFTLVRSVHGGVRGAGELLLEVLGVAERADDPEPARRVHVGQHLAQQRLGGLDLAPHLQQHQP